jgi:hypothetical protein
VKNAKTTSSTTSLAGLQVRVITISGDPQDRVQVQWGEVFSPPMKRAPDTVTELFGTPRRWPRKHFRARMIP